MNDMIVSKLGGSIVSSAENIKSAAKILTENPSRRFLIASAPGATPETPGVTDLLFMSHASFVTGSDFSKMITCIAGRFKDIADSLGVKFDTKSAAENLTKDITSGQGLEYIGSRGEYIMGRILADYLGWTFVDSKDLIFFDDEGNLEREKTFRAIQEILSWTERAVIPGFYGTMPDGKIHTFERGDGDSSGAIIACALKASMFEKWRDNGEIYSADPRIVHGAALIENLTYNEAEELNYVGVDTVKDSVLFMLRDSNIPMRINSLHTGNSILISSSIPENANRGAAICISGRRNFSVINIEKYGLNKMHGFGEKLFGIFGKHRIACEHCLSGIYKMSLVIKSPIFDLRKDEVLDEIKRAINPESINAEKNLSLIAVIGEGIGPSRGTFEKVFASLARAEIIVRVIDQGSDSLNIIVGVDDSDYERAIRALHEGLIL